MHSESSRIILGAGPYMANVTLVAKYIEESRSLLALGWLSGVHSWQVESTYVPHL